MEFLSVNRKNNIKMSLKGGGKAWTGLIWLTITRIGVLL